MGLYGREFWYSIGCPSRILAPMVDQSELAWRILSRRHGADLCYTPMFHAKHFWSSPKYRKDVWSTLDNGKDRPLIVQFCANNPEDFLKASKIVMGKCDAVDLNLGCPQNIAKRGYYGAYLQENWNLISEMIKYVSNSLNIPVTAKIRIFPDKEKTLAYARMIVESGVSILAVHGRTREQRGSMTGLSDWYQISYLRENLPLDVFIIYSTQKNPVEIRIYDPGFTKRVAIIAHPYTLLGGNFNNHVIVAIAGLVIYGGQDLLVSLFSWKNYSKFWASLNNPDKLTTIKIDNAGHFWTEKNVLEALLSNITTWINSI
ncbi:hypothetical protein PCK2_000786 [Pneumocystis canis]|nr:hypothetical protein PCK2_000786 [Pneumocystis canis]